MENRIGPMHRCGSLEGGGGLGEVDLIYIPEPSAFRVVAFV